MGIRTATAWVVPKNATHTQGMPMPYVCIEAFIALQVSDSDSVVYPTGSLYSKSI